MDSKTFRAWCEAKGMKVVHVRRVPKTGRLRAYLYQTHKGGNFAELRSFTVDMRDGNNREQLTYTYRV